MSITSNQFRSTTIYGNFYNVDNSVNSIPASAFFQRDISLNGNLLSSGIITQSGTTGFNTLKNTLIGNIGQNIGSTISQTYGTTTLNQLNQTQIRGNLNVNQGDMNVSNGNLTITNGNIVSSIKQVGSLINNTLSNCSITNSLTVAGVDFSSKANISYVDTGLSLKLNITDYNSNNITNIQNLQDQINLKVNTTDYNNNNTTLNNAIGLKVNTTDYNNNNTTLNNAIGLKVNTTDYNTNNTNLNNAIGLKVNTTDYNNNNTTLNNAIGLKTDKTYTDSQLALKLNINNPTITGNLIAEGNLDISRNLHVHNTLQTSPLHYNDSTPITNLSYLPTNPFVGSETNILTFNINTNNSIFTLNINTPLSNQESGTLGASVSTTNNRINNISLFLYQNDTLLQTITASYTLSGTYNSYSPTGSSVGYSYQQYLGMVSGSFVINTTTLNNDGTDLFSIRMTITSQRINPISGSSFGYILNTNVSGKSSTGPITINQTRTGYISPAYTTTNQSLIYSTVDTYTGSITCNEILSNTLYNQGAIDTGSMKCNSNIYTSQLFATAAITGTILTAVGFIQAVRTITTQNVYLPETPLANIYLLGYNSGMNVNLAYASEDYIGSIYYIRKIPPLLTNSNISFILASGCKLYDNLTVYTDSTPFTNTNYTLLYGGSGVWYFLNKAN